MKINFVKSLKLIILTGLVALSFVPTAQAAPQTPGDDIVQLSNGTQIKATVLPANASKQNYLVVNAADQIVLERLFLATEKKAEAANWYKLGKNKIAVLPVDLGFTDYLKQVRAQKLSSAFEQNVNNLNQALKYIRIWDSNKRPLAADDLARQADAEELTLEWITDGPIR